MEAGYLRTVAVLFKRGNENTNDDDEDITTYYTNVQVEHQFKSDSGTTRDSFMPMHDAFNGASGINGIFSEEVKMNPSTISTDVHTCTAQSLGGLGTASYSAGEDGQNLNEVGFCCRF